MIPFAILQLFSGAVSDVRGRVPVLLSGLVLFTLGLIMSAASVSLVVFAAAHAVIGAGWGFVNPVIIALVTDLAPADSIPERMGIIGAVGSIGVGMGPVVAGLVVEYSWRWFYVWLSSLSLVALVTIVIVKGPPHTANAESGVRILVSNITEEWRRPVVLLTLLLGFMFSETYLASLVWTSRALSGLVDEPTVAGILLMSALVAAIVGVYTGGYIRRRGVALPMIVGTGASMTSSAFLMNIADFGTAESLPLITAALLIVGVVAGTLYPVAIYYSQVIAPQKRGALAGLLMSVQFAGMAVVPVTYEQFFAKGTTALFAAILGASVLLLLVVVALYRRLPLRPQQ
jgi:MFS family permease